MINCGSKTERDGQILTTMPNRNFMTALLSYQNEKPFYTVCIEFKLNKRIIFYLQLKRQSDIKDY